MNLKDKLLPAFVALIVVGGAAAFVSELFSRSNASAIVDVKVPKLSETAAQGKRAFDANCATCHGESGSGSDQGPPLVHSIYNPGHHADDAFFLAAKRGVRQHHWRFGNMPPLPDMRDEDLRTLVQYVRELQRANGITFQPHNM